MGKAKIKHLESPRYPGKLWCNPKHEWRKTDRYSNLSLCPHCLKSPALVKDDKIRFKSIYGDGWRGRFYTSNRKKPHLIIDTDSIKLMPKVRTIIEPEPETGSKQYEIRCQACSYHRLIAIPNGSNFSSGTFLCSRCQGRPERTNGPEERRIISCTECGEQTPIWVPERFLLRALFHCGFDSILNQDEEVSA